MKDKYIAEILQYVNSQDESLIKGLADLTHFVDRSKLIYIITFVNKLFGSH